MSQVKRRMTENATAESAAAKAARLAVQEAARADREAKRLHRLAMRWRDILAEVINHAKLRLRQRRLQEAGVEWLMGYSTPAAEMFAKYVASAEAAQVEAAARARAAGDPLNLTGEKPKQKPNSKQERKKAESERLARGERKILIADPDRPNQNVLVNTMAHSLRRVKLSVHQEPAAQRFIADWESAGYSGLSSPGFDPKVDSSGGAQAGHLRAAEAQKRLNMAKRHIGERNYDICCGVLLLNINATRAHALGGRDHRSISHDIDVALNALAGFYDPVRLERDPTWKAFKKVLDAGNDVIRRAEEEVR